MIDIANIDYTTIVDAIFSGINFLILLALAVYGFTVYVLPGIRSAIQERNAQHDTLIAQRTQLREACRDIENQITQQEEQYHHLYDIITTWSRVMHETEQKYQELRHKQYEAMRHRRNEQERNRVERNILQQYVPDAFEQAERMLQEQYDHQRGVAYIRSVVQQVEQRHGGS